MSIHSTVALDRILWVACLVAMVVAMMAVITGASAADDAATQLPKSAQDVIVKMDKDLAAARDRAVVVLEKLLKDTGKKGDLDGCTAITAKISELKNGVLDGFANDWALNDLINGTWTYTDGGVVFTATIANGVLHNSDGNTALVSLDGSTLTLAWKTGQLYHLDYAAGRFSGHNPQLVTLVRSGNKANVDR